MAEIGFTLARRHQGQGYATEALSGLLDHAFRDLDLHRVKAICDVKNKPAVSLLERLGMRREGTFIESVWFKEAWGSEHSYALLRREWMERRAIGRPARQMFGR